MRAACATIVLLFAVGARAAPAADTEAEEARVHAIKARRLFDLAAYDRAIEEYQAAYNLKGDPSLLFNIGQCERLAGHLELAVVYYKDYLQRSPKSPKRKEISDAIDALEAEIAAKKAATPTVVEKPPVVDPTPPPKLIEPRSRRLRFVGLGLTVGGVLIAAGGGLGFGFAAASKANQVSIESSHHDMFDPSLESSGRLFQNLSYVAYAVGGALAVAGVVLMIVDARRGRSLQASAPLGFRF